MLRGLITGGVFVVFFSCTLGGTQYETSMYENCTDGVVEFIGDGYCDGFNNKISCSYDGGDCCRCSCLDGLENGCGINGFDCLDEDCLDSSTLNQFPDCAGTLLNLGDGDCDRDNNTPECGYDGGDCCLCTCVDSMACTLNFNCIDPDAGDELYACDEIPSKITSPCSDDVEKNWIVEDAAQAQTLAETSKCSGGYFQVEWRGNISMDETIYAVGGTIVNIYGTHTGAVMSGNLGKRLITVVNASLYLTNVRVEFGYAVVGGAIAASRSNLTLNQTFFVSNQARGMGGALYVMDESIVSFDGETTIFANNVAGSSGGAIHVAAGSVVSWKGQKTSFIDNLSYLDGGAATIKDGSVALWGGVVSFSNNTCGRYGGAVYATDHTSADWDGMAYFLNNTAGYMGGAIFIFHGSNVSWSAEIIFDHNLAGIYGGGVLLHYRSTLSYSGKTLFYDNRAAVYGGAMFVDDHSNVFGSGDTTYARNSAVFNAGAVSVINNCTVSWSGQTTFASNIAETYDGGALDVQGSSQVFWSGNTTFANNSAKEVGGGISLSDSSTAIWMSRTIFTTNTARAGGALFASIMASVYWDETTYFFHNSANETGGAVLVDGSDVAWRAKVIFNHNFAGLSGGGLALVHGSTISWIEETRFQNNKAGVTGGAMLVNDHSGVFVRGDTTYTRNSAFDGAGAISVATNSTISWNGETTFASNIVENGTGGALIIQDGSQAFWSGKTTFTNNSARSRQGGAIVLQLDSTASWNSETTFTANTATAGGAVYTIDNCTVTFNGKTTFDANAAHTAQGGALSIIYSSVYFGDKATFVGNTAMNFGGAVAVMAEISALYRESPFVLAGSTVFENNTCEANGGALSLVGGVLVKFETNEILFSGNRAAIAGGAIFMWGNNLGPYFTGVNFSSNFASHGGGVYSTGSGNALVGLDSEQRSNPVVFIGCSFVDNQATATGGAIHSAAGQDLVINTTFSGNTASEGGALNLAGTTSLVNCSFVENISDGGRGPVVANIGYMSGISNCSFHSNAFSCQRGEFLGYHLSNNVFEVLCNGCKEPCKGCYFERPSMSPFCSKTMENSHSPGGLTTIELVMIDPGYWRATPLGKEVLPCYNTDACLGGQTGASNVCLDGYEGPYCAICSDGSSGSLGFTCKRCSNSTGGIVVAIVVALALIVAVILAVSYLLSAELERGTTTACLERLMRYIPMQSVKIVIVTWQIVIQFVSVANVQYPYEYQRFLDVVKLIDFDLGWMLSTSCVVDIDFHDRLLFATIGPIAVVLLLAMTYYVTARRNRQSEGAIQNIQHKHLSAVLLLTFFVYSNVSSIILQTFACEHLEDGKFYLRADYRIECDAEKHEKLQVYAAIMMIMFTLGIPVFYATLLLKNRDILKIDENSRNNCSRVLATSSLWRPYKPRVFYFEAIECIRRALLVGVLVFFNPNTASQIAVTLILVFTFVVISESLDPYASRWNTWLSRTGHVVVFFTVYVALLLKVDVSSERRDSQRAFEVVLVLFNACMIVAVIIEALVMTFSLECLYGRRRDDGILPDAYTRFRPMRWLVGRTI